MILCMYYYKYTDRHKKRLTSRLTLNLLLLLFVFEFFFWYHVVLVGTI
jgi:hypothetical protein